jgi:hypothetical protein
VSEVFQRRSQRGSNVVSKAAATAAVVLLLAGCGGGNHRALPPPLPLELADRLATQSEQIALTLDKGDGCGALAQAQALQQQSIQAINAGRVPPRFEEPLLTAANDLVARISCAPPEQEHGKKGKHKGKGRGKGDH